jgi:hypothetical protein
MMPGLNFLECVILLLIIAGLAYLLAPLIMSRVEAQRLQVQKKHEAELARQTKIVDAQARLLEDLSALLWEYQLLLITVPYYRQFRNRDRFQTALEAYEEQAGNLLGRIRAEISKALRLTPPAVFRALNQLYYDQLLPLDLRISHLAALDAARGNADQEWGDLHRFAVEELSEIMDRAMDDLANELNLKA